MFQAVALNGGNVYFNACMFVVYVFVMHAFSWLWLSCMRSFYVIRIIVHDVDIRI